MHLALLTALGCRTETVLAGLPGGGSTADDSATLLGSDAESFGADTGGPASTGDCAELPRGGVPVTSVDRWTGPDFDFDAQGRLVSIEGDGLVAWAGEGDVGIEVATDVGFDARGVQVDHDGSVLVSSYGNGTVVRFNPLTGASAPMIGGLVGPAGLEVGDPDVVYVAESASGRVFEFDRPQMVAAPIGAVSYPTHLALSPSGDVLYVSDLAGSVIWAIDRVGDVTGINRGWAEPRIVVAVPEPIAAIEVDSCGNLYGVAYGSGRVFRFDPETGDHVRLADLEPSGYGAFVSARWGSDRGPWRRDVLYVSDYTRLWAVEVGVPGREQPVDAAP